MNGQLEKLIGGAFTKAEITILFGEPSFVAAMADANDVTGFEELCCLAENLLEKSAIEVFAYVDKSSGQRADLRF